MFLRWLVNTLQIRRPYSPSTQSYSEVVLISNVENNGENCLNPLPDDKILVWSKLKQIVDDLLECI